MGKIKQGILGGFSGKVAGVVGSSWKGIAVIKSLPLSVANPRTAGQVGQRTKFSAVVDIASQILGTIIKPLWDRFAQQASGYNDFVSSNIGAYDSAGVLTPSGLSISKGKMAATPIASVVCSNNSDSADINIVDDSGNGLKLATDQAYLMVLDSNGDLLGTNSGEFERSSEEFTCTFNRTAVTGETIYCYLAFRRADGTVVSDSSYTSFVVTA